MVELQIAEPELPVCTMQAPEVAVAPPTLDLPELPVITMETPEIAVCTMEAPKVAVLTKEVPEPEVAVCPSVEGEIVSVGQPLMQSELPSFTLVAPDVAIVAKVESEVAVSTSEAPDVAKLDEDEDDDEDEGESESESEGEDEGKGEVEGQEDDELDAFDFFTNEPIGSRARDLEIEAELATKDSAPPSSSEVTTLVMATSAEAAASSSSEVTMSVTATSAEAAASSSVAAGERSSTSWITETESVVITTTTTTTTTINEDGEVVESQQVSVERSDPSLSDVEAMEVVDGTTAGATTTTMTTESLVAIQPSDSAATTTITDGFVEEQRIVSVQQVGVESTRVVEGSATSSSSTTMTSTTLLTTGVEGDVARTEIATPVATFYTEAVRSVSGGETGGAEGFRVVGPQGLVVPDEVLEEAGHPE